jgi:phenylpropionate dioxygenase-like ring-hydroxylating dioxygenase large terminal subunit
MLSPEKNELLTRTGPGTAMGRLMRCFWVPAMMASEIPAADEAPVRLTLLGERLVVFRDSLQRVGVLGEHCPHRAASLYYGRNEEAGLRCVYHGWKFDVDGRCVDLPSEPPDSSMCQKVRARACRTQVAGGLLWVYMGADGEPPEMPHFEWLNLPPAQVYVSRWEQDCNYAQAMEGELDSAHVGFLHRLISRTDADDLALNGRFFKGDTAPRWKVLPTATGFMACNGRRVSESERYWRLNQFLLPFYTMIPPHPNDARLVRMWVPMTDERCWVICVTFRPDRALGEAEIAAWRNGENSHRKVIPGTTRPTQRMDNDYLIDRQLQKTHSYTGIEGVRAQDAMVTESAGAIVDRSQEHLGTSDRAVIAMRKTLLDAALAHQASGRTPEAALQPALYAARATQTLLPEGVEPDDAPALMDTARLPAAPVEAAPTAPTSRPSTTTATTATTDSTSTVASPATPLMTPTTTPETT